jgi:putative multiple sugar transport system substrate-binding protein
MKKQFSRMFLGMGAPIVMAAALLLGGCREEDRGLGYIGVIMPTRSAERWLMDGEAVRNGLIELGYTVNLQFSDDDIPTQIRQIDDMITRGVQVLVIASIDGSALTTQLENAAAAGIPVIAYDRLLMHSEHVSYYVSFDNYRVGGQMGDILIRGLGLSERTAANPANIELFAGSPDDNNSIKFWDGAINRLRPYFDSGAIAVPSGQTDRVVASTLRWDAALAQTRMENLLSAFYSGNVSLDGALSPYDPISLGILEAAKAVGYGTGGRPLPVVGGQDAILASIRSIIAGEQYATILKDTRDLGAAAVRLVDDIMQGRPRIGLDTTSYHNGVRIVPAILLDSVIVTRDNVMEAIVESGFHSAASLGL